MGRAIFVVEDSDSVRSRIIDMIAAVAELRVVGEANNASDAIKGISLIRPHAVVLDIQLQHSSGLDVLRTVHRRAPEVEFVVLTNFPNPQYQRACLSLGARHFLDKTTEFNQITRLLVRRDAPDTLTAPGITFRLQTHH